MKTFILTLVALLIVTTFVQPTYALQVAFSATLPEHSTVPPTPIGISIDDFEGNDIPLPYIDNNGSGRTNYTSSINFVTDDIAGTISFKRFDFTWVNGLTSSTSKTYEISPTGFGQPSTFYTINVFLSSFEFSVTPVANNYSLEHETGTLYTVPFSIIDCTLDSFSFGGYYEVVSNSEVLTSQSFTVAPTSGQYLDILSFGSLDMEQYPTSVIFNNKDTVLRFDFDDVNFLNDSLLINGTLVELDLSFTQVRARLPHGDIVLTGTPIPEPSTLALFAGITVCVLVLLKRKRFHS